jgi:hypothetical protein
MASKLLTSNSLAHEVALFIYFAAICLSGAAWFFFFPNLRSLPDICTVNGKYFIADKNGKKVVVSGNFKFITLRFSERLTGPLMKLISTIKLY